jgi:hypothetical protein
MTGMSAFKRLMAGLDTVQAAYYQRSTPGKAFSFEPLLLLKEAARADRERHGTEVSIGSEKFLVQPYGSRSGYPLVLEHHDFSVECG